MSRLFLDEGDHMRASESLFAQCHLPVIRGNSSTIRGYESRLIHCKGNLPASVEVHRTQRIVVTEHCERSGVAIALPSELCLPRLARRTLFLPSPCYIC